MPAEFGPNDLIIVTTSFFPKFDESESDKVRGNLAISLSQKAVEQGINLVVIDGGSTKSFLNALVSKGVHPIRQEKKGMDQSRFQAYREAHNNNDSKTIAWVEIEKAPLISNELLEAAKIIAEGKARIVVPARSEEGLNSLPNYQKISELSANAIIRTTLERHKRECPDLFPNLMVIPQIDWFFGPKIFDRELYPEFANVNQFWSDFIQKLRIDKPDLLKYYGYSGPLILPVIYALHKGLPVVSYEMKTYRYPKEQTKIEDVQKGPFLEKRKNQLVNINRTVDYFCQYLRGSL